MREEDIASYAEELATLMEHLKDSPLSTVTEILECSIPTRELPPSLDTLSFGELKSLVARLVVTIYGEGVDPALVNPLASPSVVLMHESIMLSIRHKQMRDRLS